MNDSWGGPENRTPSFASWTQRPGHAPCSCTVLEGSGSHHFSGRQITDAVITLEEVAAFARAGNALILIDGCDDLDALAVQIRILVTKEAHPSSRIVLASRQAPQRIWHAAGWDSEADSMPLTALEDVDAEALR